MEDQKNKKQNVTENQKNEVQKIPTPKAKASKGLYHLTNNMEDEERGRVKKIRVTKAKKNGRELIIAKGTIELYDQEIEVTMKAPPEAWMNILYAPKSRYSFPIEEVFYKIHGEIIGFIKRELPPRGIHARRDIFTIQIKRFCARTYCLCEYWLKKPRNKWPNTIKEAVSLLEKRIGTRTQEEEKILGKLNLISSKGRTMKPTPAILTAFFAEKFFHSERRMHGFEKWSDHFNSFRRTFISNNRRAMSFFRNFSLPRLNQRELSNISPSKHLKIKS
jgi:hypothetical protein